MSWPTPPTTLPLPKVPTHAPTPNVSMQDIRETLSNLGNIMKFVDYMWTKYCKTFSGDYCLDSQKRHIQKYRAAMSRIPTQDEILGDLSNFAQSRGSTLAAEFRAWVRSLSDIEFRQIVLKAYGGKRRSRRVHKSRRRANRTRKH